MIPPGADDETKMQTAQIVTGAWEELEKGLLDELLSEGFKKEQITLRQIAYLKYYGQLDDVEVESPVSRLASPGDVDKLVNRFEEVFTTMFTLAGKPPAATYLVSEVSVIAQVDTLKPRVQTYELQGKKPPKQAEKGTRKVFEEGKWLEAQLYELDELKAGNEIKGLAVIEAPSTTLFVPSSLTARFDEHEIIWLEKGGS